MPNNLSAIVLLRNLPRYAIFALLIFTPLARASVQGWAVTIIEMVTLIALTAFIFEKIVSRDWKWIKTPLDIPILCLLLLCVLSAVFSVHKSTSILSTIELLSYLTIYYLVIHTIRTRSQFRHLIYLIIGVAAFLAIFGIFKRFGVNPFPWWEYTDLDYGDRLTSTFGCPNHLAGYMEMAIPLLLGLFLAGFRRLKLIFMLYLTFILFTALILSLSRGGWIGAFTGLVFMSVVLLKNRHFKNRRLITSIAGAFLGIALIVLASTPVVERVRTVEQKEGIPSFSSRLIVFGGIVEMIRDHPLLGTGPGTFSTVFTRYQPPGVTSRFMMGHSDYLHFISETGLPLCAIVLWMVIVLYKKGFQKLRNPSRLVRGITIGAMSGITAILIHSIGDFNLHIPANALLFTVLTAVVVAPLPVQNSTLRSHG